MDVVVTGISTGIGHAIAKVLVGKGIHVFGSVRKPGDAIKTSSEFGDAFTPLEFDLTDEDSIAEAADTVRRILSGKTLSGLVNNAGIAVFGPLTNIPLADFKRQIDVNLTGTLRVLQAFCPLLGIDMALEGKPGRIVNISSVGGRIAMPFLGPYSISKFGIEALSDTLRRELMLHGIDVIVIGPGAVATPIWEKAAHADVSIYNETVFAEPLSRMGKYMFSQAESGLDPEVIGRVVLKALTVRKPKARYAVVPNPFSGWIIPQILPKRFFDNFLAKSLGLSPRH